MKTWIKSLAVAALAAGPFLSTVEAAPYRLAPETAAPNWTSQAAADAMSPDRVRQNVDRLIQQQSNATLTVADLAGLAASTTLNPPERDRVLLGFAASLSAVPPDAVSADVVNWLASYAPQVRVPDEHAPGLGVPLFDVAHAMNATVSRWDRLQVVDSGLALVDRPEAFINHWLDASPAQQHGLNAAAALLPEQVRSDLLQSVKHRWSDPYSDLAVALVQQSSSQEDAMWVIERAGGPALNRWLQQLPQYVSPQRALGLLNHALQHGHQAASIAAMGRLAGHDLATRHRLATLLQQPETGTASAVALATNLDDAALDQTLNTAGVSAAHPHWALIANLRDNRLQAGALQP